MVKRLWVPNWSFSQKLGSILVLFCILPSFFIYRQTMVYYQNDMINEASQNVHSIVKVNNSVLDTTLKRIEDASFSMLNNKTFFDCFSGGEGNHLSDLLRRERSILSELGRQFSLYGSVFGYYLYTDDFIFGRSETALSVTPERFMDSGFTDAAINANYQTKWITGYNYEEYFPSGYLRQKVNEEYRYPLTMVRMMNFYQLNNGVYTSLGSQERPILVAHVLERSIRAVYAGTIGYNDAIYAVINENGTVISSDSSIFPIAKAAPEDIRALSGSSNYTSYVIDGTRYLLCYDTIESRGWLSVSLVPMDIVVKSVTAQVRRFQTGVTTVLVAVAVMISALLSLAITRPIQNLIRAAKRVSTGDFSANTPVPRGADFKLLTESFNDMETHISSLIEENVQIRLREKDSQIMSLSLQINPHFLYNTLNTINMLAIQNNDFETSELIVDLSEMLHFTFRNSSEKITLTDEVRWTQNYLGIMSKRYTGLFEAFWDIPDDITHYKVPKFFLQPLIENAIQHGFSEIKSGGEIKISAREEAGRLHILVQDNGKGMDADIINGQIIQAARDGGIGVSNIYRRLMLIYGDAHTLYVNSQKEIGTTLELTIPCEV